MQQQDQQDAEHQGSGSRDALISAQVLRALGQPGALHAVQVRRLWGAHYRVNVLVGAGVTCARIAHSYFLVTDEAGLIVASTPKITSLY